MSVAGPARRPLTVALPERRLLGTGWQAAVASPAGEPAAQDWIPCPVPGTAAAALQAAGRWRPGDRHDFDAEEWWFRTRFESEPPVPGERIVLGLDGVATVAEIFLNGSCVVSSDSMFAAHELDVTELIGEDNELSIRCLALAPLLAQPRRPRARWRTRLVAERNLRFFRTMLLGRTPGFADGPAVVGPFRPVWLERRRGIELHQPVLRSGCGDGLGSVTLTARLSGGAARLSATEDPTAWLELHGPDGTVHRAAARIDSDGGLRAVLELAQPERWWPHTHGTPALYRAQLGVSESDGERVFELGHVGFRSLESPADVARAGVALCVNGVAVFARGAVWTPDLVAPHAGPAELRAALQAACDAGMNMIRVPGIAGWESAAFHDLCDELGLLVWQDFMFANLDYPDRDPDFMAAVRAEAAAQLSELGRHPSLAVLCGGSEVAQQAAMTGVDPLPAMAPLYLQTLPELIAAAGIEVPYVPSAPWGGDLPFRPSRGVANYYGVGAYLRPLADARAAQVRFAAECLAFANVPDGSEPSLADPGYKRGVPRDVGAGWDFEDVRDHYLALLYGVDPASLRASDPDRYLELSRHVSGEVMAEVMGEWRRAGSPCHGALVLWLRDQLPGAGWGLLDHRDAPKAAYHHLARALAPVAVWSTDEGLDGVVAHVANDRPDGIALTLRVALYRDRETLVDEVARELCLAPHTTESHNVESLLGRFVDAAWAYRFGPPAQDLIVFSLEDRSGREPRLISQAVRHPAGRPLALETAATLGLTAEVDQHRLVLRSRRYVHGVRVHLDGHRPDDDCFALEPGRERTITLRAQDAGADAPRGRLSALNLRGALRVDL